MTLTTRMTRAAIAAFLGGALLLAGCTSEAEAPEADTAAPAEPVKFTVGTLSTQDSLPLWVAEQIGAFTDEGLPEVEIVTFQSAQECQVALQTGAVDALMTDLIVASNLQATGTPVRLATVMLGATPSQGRFAIVAAPGSGITSIEDLKGVPVGTASATITEYILDRLMEDAGIDQADVVKEEVKKMPVRYELLMAGQLKAAVLPEPFVSLAEKGGATVIEGGDDTKAAENVSQSVLAVSREYADTPGGAASIAAVLEAWDAAVTAINADPDSFRGLLVEKAGLPAPLAETYKVSEYPMAAPPEADRIADVLDWMSARGYLSGDVTPEDMLAE